MKLPTDAQYELLKTINRFDTHPSQAELAREVGKREQSLSGMVHRMAELGFVTFDESFTRKRPVVITKKGKDILERLAGL